MIHLSFPIEELEYFLLIMTRITCFIMVAPFFSVANVPARVKIGMGFFISVLIYYATMPHEYPVYATFLEMATLILKEAAVGLLLGFATDMCARIVMFSGHVVDMEMGLAMAFGTMTVFAFPLRQTQKKKKIMQKCDLFTKCSHFAESI